jgi:hypothetical protein
MIMDVVIYQTPADRIVWAIGWALLHLGVRLVGLGGTSLEFRDDPEREKA